jgi:hypothetical protein
MAQNKFVGLTFTQKRRIDPALKRAFNVRSKTCSADSGEAQGMQQFTTLKTADFVTSTWTQSTVLGQWALNYLFKIVPNNEKRFFHYNKRFTTIFGFKSQP